MIKLGDHHLLIHLLIVQIQRDSLQVQLEIMFIDSYSLASLHCIPISPSPLPFLLVSPTLIHHTDF
jgi:hypothetical protein